MPTYNGHISCATATTVERQPSLNGLHVTWPNYSSGSVLPNVFNACWVDALQSECTHFAMVHADVSADPGWLDILMDEMERTRSHMLSCVIPIKDNQRRTSTGYDLELHPSMRTLTYDDVANLPATFDISDVRELKAANAEPVPKGPLLVNTGMMLVDIRDRDLMKMFAFSFDTQIRWDDDGGKVFCDSEDWRLSRDFDAAGLTVMATTKVKPVHWGVATWRIP